MNYTLIEQWRQANELLATAKSNEMKLRKQLYADAFESTETEGSHHKLLDKDWTLSITVPYTRSLDQSKMPEVLKALKKAKAPESLIRVKYELSLDDYRKVPPEIASIVDNVLTTKPGTPSMKLTPPKS